LVRSRGSKFSTIPKRDAKSRLVDNFNTWKIKTF
jgi:hypothetical protein